MITKKITFEIIWLAGLVVLAYLMSILPGIRPLDINMHDTYIMVDGHSYRPTLNSYPVVLYILILCLFYFVRCLIRRFSDLAANIGLLISTAIALFFYGDIVTTFTVVQIHFASIAGVRNWFYLLRIALMIVLTLDIFMTARNWKKVI